jgi:hypothetical protein
LIEGVILRITSAGILPILLDMCRNGEIEVHRHIEEKEIELRNLIGRGAAGKIYDGLYNGR